MKKFLCILVSLFVITSFVSANEKEELEENFRMELVLADSVSTNFLTMNNTVNMGIRMSTYNDNIGFLGGALFRQSTAMDFSDFGHLYNFKWTPYIGADFWNNEVLLGVTFYPSSDGEMGFSPYVSYSYLLDIIKPSSGLSNTLSFKFGLDYYFDVLTNGSTSNTGEDAAGIAVIAAFSTFIPKAHIGLQYNFGYGFSY